MKTITAIDVSGSTSLYTNYYLLADKICKQQVENLIYVWNLNFKKITKDEVAMLSPSGGTDVRKVIEIANLYANEKIKLVVITDSEIEKSHVDYCLRFSLRNVEMLDIFFLGESYNMHIEECLYRKHMKLRHFDSSNYNSEIPHVSLYENFAKQITSVNFHEDSAYQVVAHVARYGSDDEKKNCRAIICDIASDLRRQCMSSFDVDQLYDNVKECFDILKNRRANLTRRYIDDRLNFMLKILENKSKNLFHKNYLFSPKCLLSEKNLATEEKSSPIEYIDPITYEECDSTLCFLLTSGRTFDEKDPFEAFCRNSRSFILDSVDFNPIALNTYMKQKEYNLHVKSPFTQKTIVGIFALDYSKYFKHNSYSLGKLINHEKPGLYGNHSLWHLAFCYTLLLHFENLRETIVEKYLIPLCAKERCCVSFNSLIEPSNSYGCIKTAIWYASCVSILFESGPRNVPRRYPFFKFHWIMQMLDPLVKVDISRNKFVQWYSLLFQAEKKKKKGSAFVMRTCGFPSILQDVFVEPNKGIIPKDTQKRFKYLDGIKSTSSTFDNIIPSEILKTKCERGLFEDWQKFVDHTEINEETGRPFVTCKISGLPWKECAGNYDIRRASLFEFFARFSLKKGRFPLDGKELLQCHHDKFLKSDNVELVYPPDVIDCFEKVCNKFKNLSFDTFKKLRKEK